MDWRRIVRCMERLSFKERIARIEKGSGCWLWTGTISKKGYGRFDNQQAHRLMYEDAYGYPVPRGLLVRHTCDVRACVKPSHLRLGTPADNSQDMKSRSRQARGERHSQVKLTEAAVLEIRSLIEQGVLSRVIAERFGISQPTVSNIKTGKSWGWLPRIGG